MGGAVFYTSHGGASVKEAFRDAVDEARYENGHGGYTGTIAEKHDYKCASSRVFENRKLAREFAEGCIENDDHWCQDKWGPAAYVSFKKDDGSTSFLFFGWASD